MEKTRGQRLANDCWAILVGENRFGSDPTAWKDQNAHPHASKYLAALRKTTNRVYNSGPGLALAFLRAKGDDKDRRALKWAAEDLEELVKDAPAIPDGEDDDLIETIRSGGVRVLMQVTEEMLGAITWLTRYLEGEDVEPAKDEEDSADE